jgi:glutamate-1-semialdehyde 2,1-aminomutase
MDDGQQYAISKYHDVDDIYRRLDALVRQPMRKVRPEKMKEYLEYFDSRCKRSKALTDEAKKYKIGRAHV